jgi:hypothetical protein
MCTTIHPYSPSSTDYRFLTNELSQVRQWKLTGPTAEATNQNTSLSITGPSNLDVPEGSVTRELSVLRPEEEGPSSCEGRPQSLYSV